jgi:antitoxin (DNA-binding transcriptional repressor) of toxin-antitoxin stability system
MTMKAVKIAELKNRLSYYLRRVQRGEPILVYDRDRPVARIERVGPHEGGRAAETDWAERLERRGIIRRGTGGPTPEWIAGRPRASADVVGALLAERDETR